MTSPSNRLTHSLELDDLALSLLVTSQLKVLASLDGHHSLGPAVGLHTLQPQHNLLCGLGLRREYNVTTVQDPCTRDTRQRHSDDLPLS